MKEIIQHHLRNVEKEYGVKVLFAVESGSRAWGFPSPDSDWDVRFIYVHTPGWYMQSINRDRDVIEKMYEDKVDLVGFDIRKALSLLYKSNTTVLEWIHSPIVYECHETFYGQLKLAVEIYFDPFKAMMHYRGMTVNNDKRYISNNKAVLKPYLYYLRGLLACQYIKDFSKLPPVPFLQLAMNVKAAESTFQDLEEMVRIKSESKENDKTPVKETIQSLSNTLYEQFKEIKENDLPFAKSKDKDPHFINLLSFSCIQGTFNQWVQKESEKFKWIRGSINPVRVFAEKLHLFALDNYTDKYSF